MHATIDRSDRMTRLRVKSIGMGLMLAVAMFTPMSHSDAQTKMPTPADLPSSFTVISPIFSQLVSFSIPANFVVVFENTHNERYTREAVLKGETLQQWSEMITITGAKGLASAPNASAQNFAGSIAAGFKRACPDSFAIKPFGATTFDGHEAFVGVVGCGRLGNNDATTYSETTLLVAVKGSSDMYTLQWAERGAASDKANVGDGKWQDRLKQLLPIRVCPIVPGEAPPYPSCVGKS